MFECHRHNTNLGDSRRFLTGLIILSSLDLCLSSCNYLAVYLAIVVAHQVPVRWAKYYSDENHNCCLSVSRFVYLFSTISKEYFSCSSFKDSLLLTKLIISLYQILKLANTCQRNDIFLKHTEQL